MAEVVLFHHVQGLTDGIRAFAEELRAGGHTVHTPDIFDGERPATVDDGVAHVRSIGDELLGERTARAVADLPEELVYAGFSWGAGVAQEFAQRRTGARGALLYESCMPITGEWAFGPWPDGYRCRSTAWTRTRSSRWGATSTPPANWSRRSGPSWPSCSSTRAISTYSPTARCRRTTPTRRHEWCSAHGSSSTGWADSGERLDGCALGPSRTVGAEG